MFPLQSERVILDSTHVATKARLTFADRVVDSRCLQGSLARHVGEQDLGIDGEAMLCRLAVSQKLFGSPWCRCRIDRCGIDTMDIFALQHG